MSASESIRKAQETTRTLEDQLYEARSHVRSLEEELRSQEIEIKMLKADVQHYRETTDVEELDECKSYNLLLQRKLEESETSRKSCVSLLQKWTSKFKELKLHENGLRWSKYPVDEITSHADYVFNLVQLYINKFDDQIKDLNSKNLSDKVSREEAVKKWLDEQHRCASLSGDIAAMKVYITKIERQRDEYEKRLSGLGDQEALKSRIKLLEHKLSNLASYVTAYVRKLDWAVDITKADADND